MKNSSRTAQGTLAMSRAESRFIGVVWGTHRYDWMFNEEQPRMSPHRNSKEIEILQVMVVSEDKLMVEFRYL